MTLNDIQTLIAVEIDQSSSAPTDGGTDWNIRTSLINRSLKDWSESYDWKALLKTHNGLVSVAGLASYSLPADFKKLDGYPLITWDGSTTDEFPVIDQTKRTQYVDSDKYTYVMGNDSDGQFLYIHVSTLSSGASVQFTYYSSPVSLVSSGSISMCPDSTYLVQKTLYYLYKGREDGRFPEAKAEADRILARMIETENTLGQSHNDNRIPRWEESRYSFRIGRD